jgi:hypothetical protein
VGLPGVIGASGVIAGPLTLAGLLARMAVGGRVSAVWDVGASAETLVSGLFSQLNDAGAAGWHVTQGTAGNRPTKTIGGGPLGDDCITYQGTGRRLTTNTISIASGKALFFIAVAKGVEVGVSRQQCSARTGTTELAGDNVFNCIDAAATNYIATCRTSGDAEENVTITTPAHSTSWYKKTQRYAASLAPAAEINDVGISPSFVTSDGLAAAVETISFGHSSAAGGSLKLFGIFEAVTAEEEALINGYVFRRTGL